MRFLLLFGLAVATKSNVTSDKGVYRLAYGTDEIIALHANATFTIKSEHGDERIWVNCTRGSLVYDNCAFDVDQAGTVYVNITTQSIGVDILSDAATNDSLIRFEIIRSEGLYIFNEIVGWIYFVAWTVSFYPQIWLNYKRKSVEGLNFDFVLLNVIGFACYTVFNWALYFSAHIFAQYEDEHHDGVNPVQINDLFFSIHALVASIVTGIQIMMYERGDQRIGYFGWGIGALSVLTALVATIPAAVSDTFKWLDYLTVLSVVKLVITITKYMPQALMNFQRQSTVGWSIGNVLLDLTGGSFSMLQMLLQGYNNAQFSLIFGDPTKFGLGLFSILFDCLFIIQHYCLYPESHAYHPQLDDYQDY